MVAFADADHGDDECLPIVDFGECHPVLRVSGGRESDVMVRFHTAFGMLTDHGWSRLKVPLVAIFASLCALLPVYLPAFADEPLLKSVVVNGVPLDINGNYDNGYIITVGDRVILRDKESASVYFQGIFADEKKTYVLLLVSPGGRICPGEYRIIDMSEKAPVISEAFETCSEAIHPNVEQGALKISFPTPDGKANITFSYFDRKLQRTEEPVSQALIGPPTAPGGDLAAFALSHSTDQMFRTKAFADPLAKIMPKEPYEDAKNMALSRPQGSAENGQYVTAHACEAHNCEAHRVEITFDHFGSVWASILQNGCIRFYGSPPWQVQYLLDPNGLAANPDNCKRVPYIGVAVQGITPQYARDVGFKRKTGAVVMRLQPYGPAAKAGIQEGDIFMTFDGQDVDFLAKLPQLVAATPVGKVVPVTVWRAGKQENLQLTVEDMHE